MRLPDFIIAGAPRSGTTWLYELLARHPQIHMARPAKPEPKFFLVDEQFAKGLAYYAHWFEPAHPGQLAGEKSTNYLESPIAAQRIHDALPEVRLIFMLRDPVERAYSNYLWSRMNGLERETFETALALERERERNLPFALRFARPFSYFSRGLYADLLQRYFELFPRRQILVLRFEDIRENLALVVSLLAEFLRIKPRIEDALAAGVVNASNRGGDAAIPDAARQQLTAAYAEPNHRLGRLLGESFRLWEPTNV